MCGVKTAVDCCCAHTQQHTEYEGGCLSCLNTNNNNRITTNIPHTYICMYDMMNQSISAAILYTHHQPAMLLILLHEESSSSSPANIVPSRTGTHLRRRTMPANVCCWHRCRYDIICPTRETCSTPRGRGEGGCSQHIPYFLKGAFSGTVCMMITDSPVHSRSCPHQIQSNDVVARIHTRRYTGAMRGREALLSNSSATGSSRSAALLRGYPRESIIIDDGDRLYEVHQQQQRRVEWRAASGGP